MLSYVHLSVGVAKGYSNKSQDLAGHWWAETARVRSRHHRLLTKDTNGTGSGIANRQRRRVCMAQGAIDDANGSSAIVVYPLVSFVFIYYR